MIKIRYSVNLLYSKVSYEIQSPLKEIEEIGLTGELGWMLGLYCADGNIGPTGKQIRFSLHSKEIDKFERVKSYIDSLEMPGDRFFNSNITAHHHMVSNQNGMVVYFSSQRILSILRQFVFGDNAHTKRLNLELLMKTSSKFRKAFLQGMLDGDGHMIDGKYWKLDLCNKDLVNDFKELALSVAQPCHTNEQKPQFKGETLCYKYGLRFDYQNQQHDLNLNEIPVKTIGIQEIIPHAIESESFDIEVEDGFFMANDLLTHNSNSEYVLLGTRGNPKRVNKGVHSVVWDHEEDPLLEGLPEAIVRPVMQHSAKPPEIRDRIVTLMGDDLRYVELFARPDPRIPSNWTLIGNEIDGLDIRDALTIPLTEPV